MAAIHASLAPAALSQKELKTSFTGRVAPLVAKQPTRSAQLRISSVRCAAPVR